MKFGLWFPSTLMIQNCVKLNPAAERWKCMAYFMNKLIVGCLIFLQSGMLAAQSFTDAERIYSQANHIAVAKYQFDDKYEYLTLASSFSSDAIREIPFTDRRIIKIDLAYTEYHESGDFDQRALDISRLQKLIHINPQIIINSFFDWNIVGQTGCDASKECLEFFHGFVIYYEDYFTKEATIGEIDSIQAELDELDQIIQQNGDELVIDYKAIECEYPELYYSSEFMTDKLSTFYSCPENFKGRVFFEVDVEYNGRPKEVFVKGTLFPCKDRLASALSRALRWKRGMVVGRKQYQVRAKGFVSFPLKGESVNILDYELSNNLINQYQIVEQHSKCIAYEVDTSFTPLIPKIEKRVVNEVLIRNGWNPQLFVVDVTGSMYPFTADLLKWLKLNNDGTESHYVFFNDGDDKPTSQKRMGSTGGLYHIKSSDFREVRNTMFRAMRMGGGGDLPENNFEALLAGVGNTKSAGDIVMIADNYAFPRDASLVSGFGRKLRIILCHTEKGINTDYLNLARRYGFSLHTIKSDIINLNQPMISIEGINYRQENGRFIRIH